MKKQKPPIFAVVIIMGFLSLSLLGVFAVQSTLADNSASSLQSQVQSLEQEIASKAASLKNKVNQKLQNKIAEGTVYSTSNNQMVLSPVNNYSDNPKNQTVLINNFTTYNYASKKLTKTINKDDYVIALGDVDDAGNLAAKEIIKAPSPGAVLPDSSMGKVVSIAGSTLTIETKSNQTLLVVTNVSTSLYSGDQEITFSQIKLGSLVIATGQAMKNNVFQARFVYLIPALVVSPAPTKSSASASATPSTKSKG